MRAATRLGIAVSLGLFVLISFDTCFSYKFNENLVFRHTIDKEDLF